MVKSKKVIVGTGNEGGLIAFIRSLFRAKCDASAFEEMQRKPKHKAAEAETGSRPLQNTDCATLVWVSTSCGAIMPSRPVCGR